LWNGTNKVRSVIDQLAVGPLSLDSDNFLKDNLEVLGNVPFWIVGFRLAENVVADLLSFVAENFVGSTLQIRFDQVAQEPM
jgi:hypothetical protein